MRLRLTTFMVTVLAAAAAMAQTLTGTVTGRLIDETGAALPGATVVLEGPRGMATSVSNESGEFVFQSLSPGDYTVRAELSGFQSPTQQLVVTAGTRVEALLRLTVASVTETVTVSAEAALVNPFDTRAGGSVRTQELQTLVGETRLFKSAINFLPGVVNDAASQYNGGSVPSIEGANGYRAGFQMEGVDVSMPRFGGSTRLNIPTTAVEEVKLQSAGASAEFSNQVGGFTSVVLKSGTNAFRGDVMFGLERPSWNAAWKDFDLPRPSENYWTIDASGGGPVLRDRLFFFAGASRLPLVTTERLAAGDILDATITTRTAIAKADWRPVPAHSLMVSWLKGPSRLPFFQRDWADIYTVTDFKGGGEILTGKWNWVVRQGLLFSFNIASQDTFNDQTPWELRETTTDAPRWSPLTNNDPYRDQAALLWYNGIANALGEGKTTFPRMQYNAALNWILGSHDFKAGFDRQDTEWNTDSVAPPAIFGRGYNPNLPGGFVTPQFRRVYFGTKDVGGTTQTSDSMGVYLRDEMRLGSRWVVGAGLRVDRQIHENDQGETVIDATKWSPRASVAYNVLGNDSLVVSGSYGRYVVFVPQAWAANFNRVPSGRVSYDQYTWNATLQDFVFFQRVLPAGAQGIVEVDPNHKDEAAVGLEWAFKPNWAFKTRFIYWEIRDIPNISQQPNSSGTGTIQVPSDDNGSIQKRRAVHLEIQRRLKNNWTVAANYVWSRTEGNCSEPDGGSPLCGDGYEAMLNVIDPATGVPVSLSNRYGLLATDRTHVFKARGIYVWPVTANQSLTFGSTFFATSGQPYERVETQVVSGVTLTRFLEPAGSRRLSTQTQVNANVEWALPPILKTVKWSLRWESVNLFNQQERIGVDGQLRTTGAGSDATSLFQRPRSMRFFLNFSF